MTEFLYHWHHKKSRFSRTRLMSALKWMRSNKLIPQGRGKVTTLPRSNRGTTESDPTEAASSRTGGRNGSVRQKLATIMSKPRRPKKASYEPRIFEGRVMCISRKIDLTGGA